MGMFDTLHMGERCGQTKALGQTLRNWVAGDLVELCPETSVASGVSLTSFQLVMSEGGFVVVREGVLCSWESRPVVGLPLVGNYGELCQSMPVPVDQVEEDLRALRHAQRLQALLPAPDQESSRWALRDAHLQRGLPGECSRCADVRSRSRP